MGAAKSIVVYVAHFIKYAYQLQNYLTTSALIQRDKPPPTYIKISPPKSVLPAFGGVKIPSSTKSCANLTSRPSHPFAAITSTATGNSSSCPVISLIAEISPKGKTKSGTSANGEMRSGLKPAGAPKTLGQYWFRGFCSPDEPG